MVESFDRRLEDARNLKSFLMTLASYYTVGLYLLFSVIDFVFYKQFFTEFLLVRFLVVGSIFLTNYLLRKQNDTEFFLIQKISSIPFVFCSLSINYMLFKIGDGTSAYWAGLAIVVAGLSVGFRFDWKYYLLNLLIIIFPIIVLSFLYFLPEKNIQYFLNLIFLISISVVCIAGRWFYNKLSDAEFENRKNLALEVQNRDKIIEQKTLESVRLNSLSKQFSPQIIQTIKSGEISLNSKIHRSEICAIFVDIKDSTVKFSSLDRDDLQKILSMYMDDVMGTFLKYDITIDKFLGDGVLGFSNDPIQQKDYIERVLNAAVEIKNKLHFKQESYTRFWGSEFEIRIGISSGYASVGFYGSDTHVKSYTAIGRVMNLASRINGAASANEIAISGEVLSKLKDTNPAFLRDFNISDKGYVNLKGFEHEKIKVLILNKFNDIQSVAINGLEDEVCPNGHGPLVLTQHQNGIYVMKCRYCDYVQGESNDSYSLLNKLKVA